MLAEMVSSEVAPTEFSYALVMEGYAQHGAVENILTLIQQVEGRGMAVNRRMISVLMEAYITRSAPPPPSLSVSQASPLTPSLPPSLPLCILPQLCSIFQCAVVTNLIKRLTIVHTYLKRSIIVQFD